jgi:hypothetical protein
MLLKRKRDKFSCRLEIFHFTIRKLRWWLVLSIVLERVFCILMLFFEHFLIIIKKIHNRLINNKWLLVLLNKLHLLKLDKISFLAFKFEIFLIKIQFWDKWSLLSWVDFSFTLTICLVINTHWMKFWHWKDHEGILSLFLLTVIRSIHWFTNWMLTQRGTFISILLIRCSLHNLISLIVRGVSHRRLNSWWMKGLEIVNFWTWRRLNLW